MKISPLVAAMSLALGMGNPMAESFQARGDWDFTIFRGNGDVEVISRKNLIVNVGFDFICDAIGLASGRPGVMSHIAVGTGTTAPAAAQTALVTELSRLSATYSHTAGTKTFKITTTFNPGVGTGAITEAAILNAASSGIMLNRVSFPVINKGAPDTVVAEFTFTLS